MLQVIIPAAEHYDEVNNLFFETKNQVLQLEHSLVSLARWESHWKKPFLGPEAKSLEETLDYVRCMTITQNIDPIIYKIIPKDVRDQITDYINTPMTATKFVDNKTKPGGSEIITAEIIYFWMVSLGIPFECQKWHLNRLLTLVRVCNIKNAPQNTKKMGRQELLSRNHQLNELRKQQFNSRG